jgi:hypothetical protein
MASEIYVQCPTFRKIRNDNLFYADKTEYIYRLIGDCRTKILCRPFGFGKTLLIDTLEELFRGNRELFKGLWIDSSDYSFEKHPVIRLNLNITGPIDSRELNARILKDLQKIAKSESLPLGQINPHLPLEDVIFSLYRKYNPRSLESNPEEDDPAGNQAKVVVLIDDYDAPVLNNLKDPSLAQDLQKTLYSFYRSFQNLEQYCRFILLTGQTKLGSGWSGANINQITDVSYLSEYAGICGFSHAETERLTADQFETIAPALILKHQFRSGQTIDDLKQAIFHWYDGYIFGGSTIFDEKTRDKIVKVLNPFAILSFFANQAFGNYWINAQDAAFLSRIVAKKPERFIGDDFSGYSQLSLTQLENPPMGPLLFQTGYLTLKEVSVSHGLMSYNFKVPNLEVSLGFRVAILEKIFNLNSIEELQNIQKKVEKSLSSHNQVDWEAAFAMAVALLTFRPPRPGDFFYRIVFQLFIYCLGFEIHPEDPPGFNRLELVQELFVAKKAREGAQNLISEPFLP